MRGLLAYLVSPLQGDFNGHATTRQHSKGLGLHHVLDKLQTDDDSLRVTNRPANSLKT